MAATEEPVNGVMAGVRRQLWFVFAIYLLRGHNKTVQPFIYNRGKGAAVVGAGVGVGGSAGLRAGGEAAARQGLLEVTGRE